LTETGCDMVMAGRALTARPWLFWQVGERLGLKPPTGRSGLAPQTPEDEGAEYGRALLQMIELFQQEPNEEHALRQFRFFVRTGSVWLDFGNSLVGLSMKAKTLKEAAHEIGRFFETPKAMSTRTLLRQ
jgi:tRNA-dihydrouridine synthase B